MVTPKSEVLPAPKDAPPKVAREKTPKVATARLCCFWNTATGCKKTDDECDGLHRLPVSDAEHKDLAKFLKRFRRLSPKP